VDRGGTRVRSNLVSAERYGMQLRLSSMIRSLAVMRTVGGSRSAGALLRLCRMTACVNGSISLPGISAHIYFLIAMHSRWKSISYDDALADLHFTLENHANAAHSTAVALTGLPAGRYRLLVDGKPQAAHMPVDGALDLQVPIRRSRVAVDLIRSKH
jgi:hypothetical protein